MAVNIQTIKDIRLFLTSELYEIYQEPEITSLANIIIKTLFNVTKLHQLYLSDQQVTTGQAERITGICKELKTGKPIQYILGETIFYDCVIGLNSATLIPRPETEELVDLIIKENRGFIGNIIDFGTGSGCIAIALAVNLSGASVTGLDISEEAIMKAEENATINNVRVSFIKDDIFSLSPFVMVKAGIIVSNPPYVRNSEKKLMNRNVLDFEPHQALFVTDEDPLLYYNAILNVSDKIMAPGGMLYFEINEAMGKHMIKLLESHRYSEIKVVTDLNGKERIIKGRKDV